MLTYILRENVLSDNTLYLAENNKVFKGGYIAIIKEYTYQNCWSDKETIKYFKSENYLNKYLNKNYPEISFFN
jgi:hypothetical protein